MGISGHSRALRAVMSALLGLGFAWFEPVTALSSGAPNSWEASDPIERSAEPFGLFASHLTGGGLLAKWQRVQLRLADEMVQLALCEGDPDRCASPAAQQFLAIVDTARAREGRARLGEINRAINLAIRPMGDLEQYGAIDVWSPPLATLTRGAGDCEDYAIAKFIALQRAGIPADDLRIVIMRDTVRGEDHAVAAARLDGHWLTLDNRRMAMVEDAQIRNYRPSFVIDRNGVRRYEAAPMPAPGDRNLVSQATGHPGIERSPM
ncbi:transglutaminase-like cysteine peptidase [Bradyrhizobium sp.]|uniref:transglutaminase-like cysteine peptidase n=1 Tax=Bradyrhizobium sp. TaxID=376 RepID=UPI000ACAB686|nr:transglutaminase-like cysteine peptidase [Bradyrhizobium sp.]